ncbi:hypothetical protein [Mucisphaera calidilacus]|uniref:SGNH/GDSL hydrolase family protein n=1 Tax=Mucisphaera calidilacus TaxID=2527982 RepID=A0A518BV91_9BACT|nr:hypothetical protein [Mucisphaera calidilacus]QDU70895.1 hypothetical protein Pan265_07370 [Mucisphaera calidilacus]
MNRRRFLRVLLSFVLVVVLPGSLAAEPVRVLFVGNSYTYFNNLPEQVRQMAASRGIEVEVHRALHGGYSFERHCVEEDGSPGDAWARIAEGGWDVIVMQEMSTGTLWDRRPRFFEYGEKLVGHVRAHEEAEDPARIVLYMTWARRWMPETQPWITQGYSELATELGLEVAPVGLAWERSRVERPDLELFDPDQTHPGPSGSYLGACVFFQVMFDERPVGLPRRMEGKKWQPKDGLPTLVDLSAEDARYFQRLAEEVVGSYDPSEHVGDLGEAPPWRNPPKRPE